jgi:hypothetical protein
VQVVFDFVFFCGYLVFKYFQFLRQGSNLLIAELFSDNLLQARKLEAQLDEQMSAYRKLVSTNVSTKGDAAESDVESWIERLIKQLQQVNSQMQVLVSSGGSDMVSHTLTRHQEILHDITQVFNVNGSDAFFFFLLLPCD